MPRAWIFQCNPRRYSLLGDIADGVKVSNWAVSQHRAEISKDDRIFFRITNPRGGIYATGTVLSNPYPAKDEFGEYKVKIRCDALIDPPILRDETDNQRKQDCPHQTSATCAALNTCDHSHPGETSG